MTLIIFCHPDPRKKSHSHKILNTVEQALKEKKEQYEVLDLYHKEFECVFTEAEYCRMKDRIRETEHDVESIQKRIKEVDNLIFIYPVWWYNMPAQLKGFMDRVFSNGFAYNFFRVNKLMLFGAWIFSWIPGIRYLMQPYSATGHLKGKKALIFRTYGGPKLGKRVFGNAPDKTLEQVILRFCGITNIKTHELFNCDKSAYTQAYEDRYLEKTKKLLRSL